MNAEGLQYPRDKEAISRLSLEEKQVFYAGLLTGGITGVSAILQDVEFQAFWRKTYLRPVKWKRRWLKVKRFFTGG